MCEKFFCHIRRTKSVSAWVGSDSAISMKPDSSSSVTPGRIANSRIPSMYIRNGNPFSQENVSWPSSVSPAGWGRIRSAP